MVCGMDGDAAEGAGDITLVARRNNALSSGSRLLVPGSLVSVVLAISLRFALSDAWLILPFAGLEVLAVGLASRYMEQHAGDRESMTMDDDRVVIERCVHGGLYRFEFNRLWTRLVISELRRHRTRQIGVAIPR
jgi:uncharacterized membrane protein